MRGRRQPRPARLRSLLAPEPHPARGLRRRSDWQLPVVLLAGFALGCVPEAPESGIPTHPSDRFSVTLAWDAPGTDAQGAILEDLAGYRVYHGSSMPPNGPSGTMIEVGEATQYTLENLEAGTYFFAVTAIDRSGNESDLSQELRVEVGWQ